MYRYTMPMKAISVGILLLGVIISSKSFAEVRSNNGWPPKIEHGVLYFQENKYAGWPANNGIWIWDNEILVGFVEANHKTTGGLHTYDKESARHKYARSTDGGRHGRLRMHTNWDRLRGEMITTFRLIWR